MLGTVLFVDDDLEMRRLVKLELTEQGYAVTTAMNGARALELLAELPHIDVLITDMRMPRMSGLDLCRQVHANQPGLPVIVLTGFGTMEAAVEALRAGAYDFVTKPIDMPLLHAAASRAVQQSQLKREITRLGNALRHATGFGALIGQSSAMVRLYDRLHRVARTDASVLIFGESGTGKELVARGLHEQGERRGRPLVAINCSALPEQLLESELFGHARGSFTGARDTHRGLFAQADGGTLFLDEVGELPMALQPKLLRALEERMVRPVGSEHEIAVDVRIIAATNRDLEAAVHAKEFRADLFYRLNVVDVDLPPLRARGADSLLLAAFFVEHFARRHCRPVTSISEQVAQTLLDYDWPGNVRELRNAIERAVALSTEPIIRLEDLPMRIRRASQSTGFIPESTTGQFTSLEVVQREYVRHVFENVGGNKSLAARILEIDRKTLRKKLQALDVPED